MAKHKKKITNLSDNVRNAKRKTETRINPFEVKINRQKHDVLGRKLSKFDKGMPGVSRSKAIQKRKDTLLHEYKQRGKTNKFIDRRFAENDAEMSLEDKMLKRFALEKQKTHEKGGLFNLNETEDLTHYGQSLSQIERFEEPIQDSDEEDEDTQGRLSAKHVSEEHFGGFFTRKEAEDAESKKSWKERMEETIAASKKAKYERQMEREKTLNLTEQLDAEWKGVRLLMGSTKKDNDTKDGTVKHNADDYDIAVRELKFEIRGQPTDRLKTEEELAKDEKERLEQLEADRVRRMKGLTETEADASKKRVHFSADQLDDDFVLDSKKKKKFHVSYKDGKVLKADDDNNSDDDDNSGDDSQGEEDDDDEKDNQSGDEKESGDQESDQSDNSASETEDSHSDMESEGDEVDSHIQEDKQIENTKKSVKFKKELVEKPNIDLQERKEMMESARKELPYVFNVPENYEDLLKTLEGHTRDNKIIIIERIKKCNHPSLAEGNKEKLQMFYDYLLEYFGELALSHPVDLTLIDKLIPILFEFTQKYPQSGAKTLVSILQNRHQEFIEIAKKKGGRGIYPGTDTMLYLKLISILFPTSDFKHPVVTPAILFMSQIITQCPVKNIKDVFCGLFVCTLFLEYVSYSKRFVPEAINFLHGVLFLATKNDPKKLENVIPPFKPVGDSVSMLLLPCKVKDKGMDKTSSYADRVVKILTSDVLELETFEFRQYTIHICLKLIEDFARLYKDLSSFREVFAPICDMCSKLPLDYYPRNTQELHKRLTTLLTSQSIVLRQYLVRDKKRPQPLRQYEPSFEESFDGTRKKSSGNKDVNEKQRLIHKHRKEMKGAIREIKKDNQFLARQQLKDQLENDAERKQKVQVIHHMLATQEGEFKAMKRKKNQV